MLAPTARTTVKRRPARASYDREVIHGILDEALVCHLGFAVEGQPFVIPTTYARIGDTLYVHGSAANHALRSLARGLEACVTVTLLDGLVLARSAFHHSMNYRSVVVFGIARVVDDPEEKLAALRALIERLAAGRWEQVRTPSAQELQMTLVLALPLAEASAKIRTGPPLDDEDDRRVPVWAGEIPLVLAVGEPVDDPQLAPGFAPPRHVTPPGVRARAAG